MFSPRNLWSEQLKFDVNAFTLAQVESIVEAGDLELACQLETMGDYYRSEKDFHRAEVLYLIVLALRKKALGLHDSRVAISLLNVADLYRQKGVNQDAEHLYQQALSIMETLLGAGHLTVALSMQLLVDSYLAQERYAEAEPLQFKLLQFWENALGPDHEAVAARQDRYLRLLNRANLPEKAMLLRLRNNAKSSGTPRRRKEP